MVSKLLVDVDVDVRGQDKLRTLGGGLKTAGVELIKWTGIAAAGLGAVGLATANFASDTNESLSKVGVVFGKNSKIIEKWAETSAESMGLSEQKALEAAGTFGNLFTAMKIGEKPALDMSTSLTELAADLASFNNIGTDEALEKLRAGIVGEAEPLRTLGINISAARTEQEALRLGLIKQGETLTAAAKAQANYSLILKDSKKAQGDFARTSGGMANQQRILAATFQDAMSDIGQAFVPIIQEFLPILTDALKGFAGFVVSNMPMIKSVIETVFGAIGQAISFIVDEVFPRLGQAFQWVATNIFPIFSQASGQVGGIFASIGSIIQTFTTTVLPVLISTLQKVVAWVAENWPTISSVFGQVFGAIANVVKVVWPILARIAEVLFPLILAAASVLLKGLDGIFKLIGGIFEVAGTVAETMVEGITGAWEALKTITTTVWESITGIITGVINGVIDVINGFLGFLNGFQIGIPAIDVGPVHVGGGVIDPFNIPLIPHLASGGIIDSPTLALIGEKGPEAVVPLSKAREGAFGTRILNLEIQAPLRADDAADIAEYIDRVERLQRAMDWEAAHG